MEIGDTVDRTVGRTSRDVRRTGWHEIVAAGGQSLIGIRVVSDGVFKYASDDDGMVLFAVCVLWCRLARRDANKRAVRARFAITRDRCEGDRAGYDLVELYRRYVAEYAVVAVPVCHGTGCDQRGGCYRGKWFEELFHCACLWLTCA